MRKTLLILGVLALAAIPLFGQWHSDFRVTNNSGSSYTTTTGGWNIAADDADVHIAWRDYTNNPYYARHHTFPIGSPAQTPNGEAVSTSYAYDPVIAIHDGTVNVSWYYYSYPYFLHTRVKNGSWGSIINHGYSYQSCYYPATATDSDGNLHCVFNRYYYGYRVYYQRRNAGSSSFTSPVQVYYPGYYRYAYRPSICITSDGVIHVSVGTNNGYRLVHAYSTDNGASWNSENVTGTYQCYYSYATSICCDSDDNIYIAYISYYSPRHIYVTTNASGSWVSTKVSQSTYRYVYYPSICRDIYDNIWVSWDDRSGSTYEIYYNKLDAETGSWAGPQALTADDGQYSRYSSLAGDEKGNVHICWYDRRDGNYEIYYNWFLGDTTGGGGGGRDLACTRILQPLGKIDKVPVTPQAVVANFGGAEDSGYAMCRITGPGANYYKGNLEGIVYLDAGEEDDVSFPSWTPPGEPGDRYKVEVTVYLWPEKTTEDDDPTNNTKVEHATIQSAVQVDAIEVIKPEEGSVVDSMTPEANFKNVGTEAAENFYCYCEIVSQGYHTADYLDSVPVANLDPEEVKNVKFAQWVCDDDAPYMATFFAAIPGATHTLLGRELSVMFQGTPLVGVAEEVDALRIEVTGPNPFRSGTLVSYSVGYPISTTIRVYDVTGKAVRRLQEGELSGSGSLYWDGTDDAGAALAGGLYFIRITAPGFTKTAKVVLLH